MADARLQPIQGGTVKVILVTPRSDAGANLKAELKAAERRLRGGATAFVRAGEGKWKHVKYPGWITFDSTMGGVLVAQVQTRKEDGDWQLLQSFIGYLDRHLGEHIESVSIIYR
jgi:hypothetical protein